MATPSGRWFRCCETCSPTEDPDDHPPQRRGDRLVVGHFLPIDVELFRLLLDATADDGPGDLAELGVLYGRSAVLVGSSRREGETVTVIDLFGADPDDEHNAAENSDSYPGLTRGAFEDNYRRLLGGELPTVVQDLSHTIVDHAPHGTHRFVHVDASHLHANVVRGIEAWPLARRAGRERPRGGPVTTLRLLPP